MRFEIVGIFFYYVVIVIPIFLAVPSTIFIALESFLAYKSGNLVIAISSNCAVVIDPTFWVLGSPDPFWIFAAFANNTDAGGVFKINEKLLSSNAEISTGIIKSPLSAVLALYS